MIQLSLNTKKGIINTDWVLKLNKDSRTNKRKDGSVTTYTSYFTSFPQELYDFFDIKDEKLYLVKEVNKDYDVMITDTKPSLPINYVEAKLIARRKNKSKVNRIPTTSFTLSKKLFNNLEKCNEVIIRLHPTTKDPFRNQVGKITLRIK